MVMAGVEAPWHGTDLALRILERLPSHDAELWLIGITQPSVRDSIDRDARSLGIRDQVRMFPWMDERRAAELINAADIGLGPLALERKRLREASPLKTRMYLSLGVPILINYRDPGIDTSQAFVAHLDSLDPSELASAAAALLGRQDLRGSARRYAREGLGWSVATRGFERFIAQVGGTPADHGKATSVIHSGWDRVHAYGALARRAVRMLTGTSYWHVDQRLGRAFRPGELAGYFNDLTKKVGWDGPVDDEGLPLTPFGGAPVPFPTTRLQKALGHWDRALLKEGDVSRELDLFMQIAEWALSAQDSEGGWPVWPLIGSSAATPYSALVQGQAISVLARAADHSGRSDLLDGARRALSLALTPVAAGGVRREGDEGPILEEFPHDPPLTVLNGWVFGLFGLHDLSLIESDARLDETLERTVPRLASRLPRFDAGYWSRYVEEGTIASPFYQRLHIAHMAALMHTFPSEEPAFARFHDRLVDQMSSPWSHGRAVGVKIIEKLRSPPEVAR